MVLASDIHGQPIVGRQTSVSQMQTAGINKNTSWLSSTGAWAFYAGLVIFGWLVLSLFMDGGFAWTWIHIIHGIVTFYLLHWMKVNRHFGCCTWWTATLKVMWWFVLPGYASLRQADGHSDHGLCPAYKHAALKALVPPCKCRLPLICPYCT